MTYKLLPCPFCGGTPILELFNDGFFDYARIRCCRVMFDWCGDETGEQAIAAWNRRVDARQLALKTKVCITKNTPPKKVGDELVDTIETMRKHIETLQQENEQLKKQINTAKFRMRYI